MGAHRKGETTMQVLKEAGKSADSKSYMWEQTGGPPGQSVVIYDYVVETAKANGREPYTWLRKVLRELPRASAAEADEALLPWNLHPETLALESVGAEE